MKPNIQETVNIALDNLRPEAYYPLIRFAKHHVGIDIEKEMRQEILSWAKKNVFQNNDSKLTNKVLSTLDGAIAYIQNTIGKSNPKIAKKFFNYIKDKYAKFVIEKYMAQHKAAFSEKVVAFGKENVLPRIFRKFDKANIRLPKNDFQNLKNCLATLIEDIESNPKTLKNFNALKILMKTLPENVQDIIIDKIMKKRKIGEDSRKRFYGLVLPVVQDMQEGIRDIALRAIRNAQVQEIYKYDGLIERYLPASIRGLHNVDRKTVEQIALNGDNPKDADLFNFEVASRARKNPTYSVGHTGPSNRSSTLLTNIAMYFASNHGLKSGKPESIWMMVYAPTKGINTTELVDKNVKWTELECATKQLKASHFLGAVQLEVDAENSNKKEVAFKAIGGFVNPKVHQDNFDQEGMEGDIKRYLEVAKHFDRPLPGKTPDLRFSMPKLSSQVSAERSFFQRIFDKIGLPRDEEKYRQEREKQVQFVRSESPAEKAKRLAKEKEEARFWQQFPEKAPKTSPKVWTPVYQKLVGEMEEEQREAVNSATRKLFRAENIAKPKQVRRWR